MAEARSVEKDIPFSEALSEIARENPVLASEARIEVLNRKPIFGTTGAALGAATGGQVNERADARLTKMAETRSEEKGIPYEMALSEVGREFPDLYRRYREQVMGIKLS